MLSRVALLASLAACSDTTTVHLLVENDLREPLAGAQVTVFDRADAVLAAGTTDAAGWVELRLDPPDGFTHVRLEAAGHRVTDHYSSTFWYADVGNLDGQWLQVVREETWASWFPTGLPTPGTGVVLVRTDAEDVSALRVSATSGTVRYDRGGLPDSTATETDASGAAFVLDAPVGTGSVTSRGDSDSSCHLFYGSRGYTVVADAVVRITLPGECNLP